MSKKPAKQRHLGQEISSNAMKINCPNCVQKLDVSSLTPFERIACPKCGAEIIVPMWFDHYLFEEHIGDGKFANVYRALDLTLDREVAVKVLKPEYQQQYGELFIKAARRAAKLNHFSILPIYSCGEFNSRSYFVSQYVAEGTLADVLHDQGPQPLEKVIPWMIEITEGLYYASKENMVHHTVTLEHMSLVEGHAKISDFSSSFFEGDSAKRSLNAENEDNLDIFNLGVAFYELLTGSSPTKDATKTHNIPESIQALILKMLTEGAVNRISYSEIIRVLKGGELSVAEVVPAAKSTSHSSLKKWSLRVAVILVMATVVIAFMLYNKHKIKLKKSDYLNLDPIPRCTRALDKHNLVAAEQYAEAVLDNSKSSLKQKKAAAILSILAAGLNNEPKLSAKCAAVINILKKNGVPDNDLIYALIAYPATPKMSPREMLNPAKSSPESMALARFLIVMRDLYYGSTKDTFLRDLREFELYINKCSRGSWVFHRLRDRAVLYRALITQDEIIPDTPPDPVLTSFIKRLEKTAKQSTEKK